MSQELSTENQEYLNVGFKLISTLLGFMVFTVIVLTILPQLRLLKIKSQDLGADSSFLSIFVISSVIFAVAGFVIKIQMLKRKSEDKIDLQEKLASTLKTFHLAHLAAYALFESIAILGLINFLISNNSSLVLVFSSFSLVCMYFAWPKYQQLKSIIE